MPIVPKRLPLPLSTRARDVIQSIMSRQGRQIDYAIAGVPFLSAASKDVPFSVSTADMKKQQVDMSSEPGEHTLTGWWVRAQSSWHEGAGAKYQEITNQYGDAEPSYRFFDSDNVNPWVPGELRIDNAYMAASGAAGGAGAIPGSHAVSTIASVSPNKILVGIETGFGTYERPGVGSTLWTQLTTDFTGLTFDSVLAVQVETSTPGTLDTVYLGSTTSKLAICFDSDKSTKTFTLAGATGGEYTSGLMYAMNRLWVFSGGDVYTIPLADIVSKADASSITAWWSSADPAWQITTCCDAASTVYFAGVNRTSHTAGTVLKVVLDSAGALPTLTGGVVALTLPNGEWVNSMQSLNGTLIGLGTNLGFRVATSDGSGNLSYGPMCGNGQLAECHSVSASSSFFYFIATPMLDSSDPYVAVVAVNAAEPFPDGTFAFCMMHRGGANGSSDDGPTLLTPPIPSRRSLALGGYNARAEFDGQSSRMSFSDPTSPCVAFLDGDGLVYMQDYSTLAASGWASFGRIRFDMQEPKLFKRVGIATTPMYGSADIDLYTDGGTSRIVTYDEAGVADQPEVQIPTVIGPRTEMEVHVTLHKYQEWLGPILRNYWLKAMPAVKPQRIWQVPVMNYDRERYRSGQEYGCKGFSQERLLALQDAENGSDTVLWQDFRTDTPIGRQVVIDKLQYVETVPQGTGVPGAGGIIVATLRTLD